MSSVNELADSAGNHGINVPKTLSFSSSAVGSPATRSSVNSSEIDSAIDGNTKEINGNDVVDRALSLRSVFPPQATTRPSRNESTAQRLRRQGLRASGGSDTANFAVRSIRRGSDDWHTLIKPFVSDLVFGSLVSRRPFQSDVVFQPYTVPAAVLFVDLSGYSRISSILAARGAHVLSSAVNAYLKRILHVVQVHGGDVVKFAGDAVLIVWTGGNGDANNLPPNVQCAARCVMEIQLQAGEHPIDETDEVFHVHCGLCCGTIESEVFEAPRHVHMQRLFHSIGGAPLEEIGELVDCAQAGQVCVSGDCAQYLAHMAKLTPLDNGSGAYIMSDMQIDNFQETSLDEHIEYITTERMLRRSRSIEEDLIHPAVLRFLTHGGLSPTQIAQMRNLCVLFIAQTSAGSAVNWLMEVQSVLDHNRCPIVQIIDDDKGVHVVAAINLYEAIPESNMFGLNVADELRRKQVGCAIGMAAGSTFCGVTGASSVACRWDITGPPPVRAARLMQYAIENECDMAIDQSVYSDPMAAVRLQVLAENVSLKGLSGGTTVYSMSDAKGTAAFRVAESLHGGIHDSVVHDMLLQVHSGSSRCALVATGPVLAGKKTVCQRVAGYAELVPYMHIGDETAGFLQLARTIATWFQYMENERVRQSALQVLDHLDHERWSRAHDQCADLIDLADSLCYRACFIIDRVQFLDEFSFSLLRSCLQGAARLRRHRSRSLRWHSSSVSDRSDEGKQGLICFLCVHVALYDYMSAEQLVKHITRAIDKLRVPIYYVGETTKEELRVLFRDLADMEVEDRWLDAYAEAAGHCAGYFIERSAAVRNISGLLWSQGRRGYSETTEELILHIPPGLINMNKRLTVMQISADLAMKYAQIFDGLPPLFQTFCKILTIATRSGFIRLSRQIMWEVLNDLVAEGVDGDILDAVIFEMKSMCLLCVEGHDDATLAFRSPALGNVTYDVCTPVQIHSIADALINRLGFGAPTSYGICLLLSELYGILKRDTRYRFFLYQTGFQMLNDRKSDMSEREYVRWCELFHDEVVEAGFDVKNAFGPDPIIPDLSKNVVGTTLPRLKTYQGPVTLGPNGISLSLLGRNTFHEFAIFRGVHKPAVVSRLRRATASAAQRYLHEIDVIESFLAQHGIDADPSDIDREKELIRAVSRPAENEDEVQQKAHCILDDLVPNFVQARMNRLCSLVQSIREHGSIPDVLKDADPTLRQAYQALQVNKNRNDAAQDALMIMATQNWKPRPVPEYLPVVLHQTVARIRNRVLHRLTPSQLVLFRHQHTVDDLEAFLIVTPLLHASFPSSQTANDGMSQALLLHF